MPSREEGRQRRAARAVIAMAIAALAAISGCGDRAQPAPLAGGTCTRPDGWPPPVAAPGFWEATIENYERADTESPPEPGAIVFVGSSSIFFWDTLAADMAPLYVLNRGFGGSVLGQVRDELDRVVIPYRPRSVVLYAGDNDIGFGLSAECVLADLDAVVTDLAAALPGTPIYFLAIKPSLAREALWPEMARANALVRERARQDPRLDFLDVASPMLDDAGRARPELFVDDGLHLSPAGYDLWTSIVRPILRRDLE